MALWRYFIAFFFFFWWGCEAAGIPKVTGRIWVRVAAVGCGVLAIGCMGAREAPCVVLAFIGTDQRSGKGLVPP